MLANRAAPREQQQQQQQQQWHGAETRQLVQGHVEMQARVAHYEAAAQALEQRRDLDVRNNATVTEHPCERVFQALRSENEGLASQLRSVEAKFAQSASEEQILKTAVQNAIADL